MGPCGPWGRGGAPPGRCMAPGGAKGGLWCIAPCGPPRPMSGLGGNGCPGEPPACRICGGPPCRYCPCACPGPAGPMPPCGTGPWGPATPGPGTSPLDWPGAGPRPGPWAGWPPGPTGAPPGLRPGWWPMWAGMGLWPPMRMDWGGTPGAAPEPDGLMAGPCAPGEPAGLKPCGPPSTGCRCCCCACCSCWGWKGCGGMPGSGCCWWDSGWRGCCCGW